MVIKTWPPESPDERKYIYYGDLNILMAEWDDEHTQVFYEDIVRNYKQENYIPSNEELEKDVKLLKLMDKVF